MFLHLDFDNYKPICMDHKDPTVFFLSRMCPPSKKARFFFSDPMKPVLAVSTEYNNENFADNGDFFEDEIENQLIKGKRVSFSYLDGSVI